MTTTKQDSTVAVPDGKPEFYKVKLSHPDHHGRTVFRSISLKRARSFVERRYPRGSEAYLEHPDGATHHYEHERQGENGTDADQWAPFDPASFQPVGQAPPPGDTIWADREG